MGRAVCCVDEHDVDSGQTGGSAVASAPVEAGGATGVMEEFMAAL